MHKKTRLLSHDRITVIFEGCQTPEGEAQVRFKIRGVRKILFFCNHDGLFSIDVIKGIDDKESGYDDYEERMELEKAAKALFG